MSERALRERAGFRRRWRLATPAVLLFLAIAAPASTAVELIVEAPPALAAAAAEVRALGDLDLSAPLALTGADGFGGPVRVVLAPEGSELARNVPSWVSGYAVPAQSAIVLFPSRVPSYPDGTMEALLRHELTHLLVARAAGGRPVPRWFNEGLAAVAAREWGIEDRARFALAILGHGPESARELDRAFDSPSVSRAYALSAAFVRSLLARFGPHTAAAILHLLAADVPFDDAFRRVTHESLPEAEWQFFGREALWSTWVPFLTSTTALWMGVTLLALYAIKRRRERDATMRAAWQAEERAAARATRAVDERDEDDPMRYN